MFTQANSGNVQILKKEAFCHLMVNAPMSPTDSICSKLKEWDEHIKDIKPSVSTSALGNCHGDWYEWILAIAAWNKRIELSSNQIAILLPNISTLDANTLYVESIFNLIQDLKEKVQSLTDVSFITSNPDFVILKQDTFGSRFNQSIEFSNPTTENLSTIENIYSQFIGSIEFDNLIGYVSAKSSFRPDRRLQIAHEGSLVKALHQHIITREWNINPTPLKYYAVSTNIGPADKNALRTIATHSIITVNQIPKSAVDEAFCIDTYQDALNLFERLYSD